MNLLWSCYFLLCLLRCFTPALAIRINLQHFQKSRPSFIGYPRVVQARSLDELRQASIQSKLHNVVVVSNVSTVNRDHPTLSIIQSRLLENSKPGRRSKNDMDKIALCIEGGGMRGCVSAGAASALSFLGINDAVDTVYGSSAGAMIGAYFISRQHGGSFIYHDILPQAGSQFIDKAHLLQALGISSNIVRNAERVRNFMSRRTVKSVTKFPSPQQIADTNTDDHNSSHNLVEENKLRSYIPQVNSSANGSVLNLKFILDQVMGEMKGFDWSSFESNEKMQPLHIVASCVRDFDSKVLSREKGNFVDLPSLLDCIRVSMLVPGVTGSLFSLRNHSESPTIYHPFPNDLPDSSNSWRHHLKRVPMRMRNGLLSSNVSLNGMQTWFSNRPAAVFNSSSRQRTVSMKKLYEKLTFAWPKSLRVSIQLPQNFRGSVMTNTSRFLRDRLRMPSFLRFSFKRRRIVENSGQGHIFHNEPWSFSKHVSADTNHPALLCDAFLCEPIPYRSAIRQGATHCIVLRTRPDFCQVLGKGPGAYEQVIARRFFGRYKASSAIRWLLSLQHHRVYAEDVLLMNDAALGPSQGIVFENQTAHILPIAAVGDTATEIGQLETRREKIYEGLRNGARRVLEIFWPMMVSLGTCPDSMAPSLRRALQDNPLVTVDDVLEMIFPLSTLEQTPPPLSELLCSLSELMGDSMDRGETSSLSE